MLMLVKASTMVAKIITCIFPLGGGTELISDTVTAAFAARNLLQITVTVAVAALKDRK